MPLELVTYLSQHLVAQPDKVEVHVSQQGRVRQLEIHSAPEDAGRLIGRSGRVINSIRTLAQAANDRNERIEVHYIDPEE